VQHPPRAGVGHHPPGGGPGPPGGGRHRGGHPPRGHAQDLPALLPGGQGPLPGRGGHRPGAVHRPGRGAPPRGRDRRGPPGGRGEPVHRHLPGRGRRGAGMKRILSLLLLAALAGALLSGCGGETGGRAYQVYYRNLAAVDSAGGQGALVGERHTLDPQGDPVEQLLDLVLAQPQEETLISAIPQGVSLRKWTLNNGLLTVDFSSGYGGLSGVDLTLADYSVVLTL